MQLRPDLKAAEVNTGTVAVVNSPWTSPSTEHGDNSVGVPSLRRTREFPQSLERDIELRREHI